MRPEARSEETGLEDVRLHHLRHRFDGFAVKQGTPLPVVVFLPCHSLMAMNLRHAYTGDRETEAAAERIGDKPEEG